MRQPFIARAHEGSRLFGRRHRKKLPPHRRRLRFEPLEDRRLLATLLVNSPVDNATSGDGLVTLREAIIAANTNATTDLGHTGSGADTIEFDSNVFGTPKTLQLMFGELIISEALTINGQGPDLLTIDARNNFRIFDIASTVGNIAISGLTLANGRATGDGGAIRSQATGAFTIHDCTISSSTATGRGGGVFATTSLTVTDSAIIGNSTTNNGGGLFLSSTAPLTVTNSAISGNSASSGGGLYAGRQISITNSTVTNNTATNGGGGFAVFTTHIPFETFSRATVVDSTISGNTARDGGGFSGATEVEVTRSVITENRAQDRGGGFSAAANLWSGYASGQVTLTDTIITENEAPVGGGFWAADLSTLTNTTVMQNTGGGLYSRFGATLHSTTVTNNTASGPGGGIHAPGGIDGLTGRQAHYPANVRLNSSSVTGNVSTSSGGGIYAGGRLYLNHSTVSGNRATGSGGGIHVKTIYSATRAGFFISGSATLNSSTVSGNESEARGGGIDARWVHLNSSTVSGNTGTTGGGIYSHNDAIIRDSTITLNIATSGVAGGVWNGDDQVVNGSNDPSTVNFERSILAENTASGGSRDLRPGGGTVTVKSSLIGDNAGTSLAEAQSLDANGNLIGSAAGGGVIDPQLAPLADNGGPTKTHALLANSPALDAIPYYSTGPIPAHDYQLTNSLSDAFGGPTLVASGGTLGATGYEFAANQGLSLASALANPAQYSLEIVFRWNALSGGWQKIIDFHNLTSNVGLYTAGTGLHFLDTAFTPNLFAANTLYRLVLTRDDTTDTVRAYLDGTEVLSFLDSAAGAVFDGPNQVIHFFQDDHATSQSEAQSGFVELIRAYNEVLTPKQISGLANHNPIAVPPYDQRGAPYVRVVDGDGVGGPQVDMGAYEFQVNSNEPPVFTSPAAANVAENDTMVMTVAASDEDEPPQTVTFSIVGGDDSLKFSITAGGVLSFLASPNFEAPTDSNGDNIYFVTVQASDGLGGTATQTIDVTVLPVNEHSPVFTSTNSASVPENTTAVKTVTATDADLPAQAITFSIVGGADQSKFGITSNGVLSFLVPPDFDNPTDANLDNIYIVTVQASDGAGRTATQTIGVTVTGSLSDYGDAPDASAGAGAGNYNTRGADNGPSHEIVPGIRMGATVDGDSGTLHNTAANADDVNGALPDDEDGLTNPLADLLLTIGAQPTVNVLVTNTSGSAATLYGWIDYNGNGVFENATERASVAVPSSPTTSVVTLVFSAVPAGYTGKTYARFRLSTDAAAANPTGSASDGEVEDYSVTITRPSDGTAEATKTKMIASGLNGGPTLANGDMFGSAAASIGDLDGDGIADLAVGAPSQFGSGTPGEVRVLFMNANGSVKTSQRIASGIGGGPTLSEGDYFGHGMAALGDLDGDGVNDLLVGASKDDTGGYNAGAAYVLLMNPNGTVKSSQKIASGVGGGPTLVSDDRFGIGMTSLGDLDGDGVIDLAIGSLGDDTGGSARGAVYVVFMNPNGTVKSSQKIANQTGGGPTLANLDVFGSSLAALGDIDGDGVAEVAVGASGDDTGGDSRGAVHILFLNSNGTAKSSQKIASGVSGGPVLANGDRFSRSLGALGDLDGDGVADLAVGAYQDDTGGNGRGALHVLFLNSDGTAKSSRKIASGTGGGPTLANDDNFGASVAALGDLDGDGLTDLVVGAERDDTGGNGRGTAYVLFLKRANSNPVFTSPTAASVSENTTAVMNVTATDADVPAQTVTFSIVGGADQALLSISSSGALSFISPPDFEAPADAGGNNVYEVAVQASDGNGGTAIQNISVTVTPINDNIPVFTSTDVVSVPENSTAVITVTAADADVPAQAVTFSIAGGADQSKFMITSDGVLTFKAAPDFEQPTDANGDNLYIVIVQATDGGLSNLEAVLVTVTNVNELPGDFNRNGIVDTADYVVWRKGLGSGTHTPEDYNVWRTNYGRVLVMTPPAAASALVAAAGASTVEAAAPQNAATPAAVDLAFSETAARANSSRTTDVKGASANFSTADQSQAAGRLLLAVALTHPPEAEGESDTARAANEEGNDTRILDDLFATLDGSNASRGGIAGEWWNLRQQLHVAQ